MRASATPRLSRPALWLRGIAPDRNPLRRATDRAEALVIAALLITFLAGAPLIAILAGGVISRAGPHAPAGGQAARYRIRAVLASNSGTEFYIYGMRIGPYVRARWAAPNGTRRTGDVIAPAGAKAGSTVMVWVSASGQLAGAPSAQSGSSAVVAAVLAVAFFGMGLLCAADVARDIIDRRRMASWDAEWRVTGPRWSSGRR
jgi:hypothetical protein